MDSISPPLSHYPNPLFSAAVLSRERSPPICSAPDLCGFYNTSLNMFINCSSLLQIRWCTHALQSRAAAWSAWQTGTMAARGGKEEAPSAMDSSKFMSTVWSEMNHFTLLPSFLTSHFGEGWGCLGRYTTRNPWWWAGGDAKPSRVGLWHGTHPEVPKGWNL